jgi:hypothetical protein
LLKDENVDLLANSYAILNRWNNYVCQLLNVQDNDEPSSLEIETNIEKFGRYKLAGPD